MQVTTCLHCRGYLFPEFATSRLSELQTQNKSQLTTSELSSSKTSQAHKLPRGSSQNGNGVKPLGHTLYTHCHGAHIYAALLDHSLPIQAGVDYTEPVTLAQRYISVSNITTH